MSETTQNGLGSPSCVQFTRELLRSRVSHPVHDYIIEGVCKAVDGTHLVATVKTGGGKSSYFYCYILVLIALEELLDPCPFIKRKYPKNLAMVIIFPTKGLEEQMVYSFYNVFFGFCSFL